MEALHVANGSPVFAERPPDNWTWIAYYSDGSTIRETDDRPFADVTADGRVPHTVECQALREGLPSFALLLAEGEQPVFFRQRHTPWLLAGGAWKTITCLGRERADGTGSYTFWDDDLHVVSSPRRDLSELS